jgi:hypothetical protein
MPTAVSASFRVCGADRRAFLYLAPGVLAHAVGGAADPLQKMSGGALNGQPASAPPLEP